MKIIFIGQKGIGNVAGGVEKHVEALAVRLVKKGHQPTVYVRNYLYKEKKPFFRGVRLRYLPTIHSKHLDTIVHTFLSVWHIFLFQRKVDVIHFHSIGPSSLLWMMRLLKPRTRVIATMHSKCYEHSKWGTFAQSYLQLSEWLCCVFAQRVIVISQDLKEYLKSRYHIKAQYIPNGAEIKESQSSEKILKKWGLKKKGYLLSVGRLIPGKKIDILITAYKRLNTTKKLVIVGDGTHTSQYVSDLYKQARHNKNIIFTGYQSSEIITGLMQQAYVFVFPSESEGMSLVLLEAMAAKLPIIASDIVGNRMILDSDECTYVSVNNTKVLQTVLQEVLKDNTTTIRRAERAYLKMKEQFSWDRITEDTLKVYQMISK